LFWIGVFNFGVADGTAGTTVNFIEHTRLARNRIFPKKVVSLGGVPYSNKKDNVDDSKPKTHEKLRARSLKLRPN
jgi:hypothetical protein